MAPERERAIQAILLDHFHLFPDQIEDLTDHEIFDLYFHERGEDGSINVPGDELGFYRPPDKETYENELAGLFTLGKAMNWSLPEIDRLKRDLDKKYGRADG